MDYIAFSRSFFAATGIPVDLLYKGKAVYSSLGELIGYTPDGEWDLYPPTRNPEFSATDPDLEHGHVKIEGTAYDLFLGPIFTSQISDYLVSKFMTDTKTPSEYRETVEELLYAIPVTGHPQFSAICCFCICVSTERMSARRTSTQRSRRRQTGAKPEFWITPSKRRKMRPAAAPILLKWNCITT